MTDYTELVKALRYCWGDNKYGCGKCQYHLNSDEEGRCTAGLDAAAAIEELQQIADHYEQTAKDYWKEACEYKAQLPKRGEWVVRDTSPITFRVECSVCGAERPRNKFDMPYESAYCPSCGAKMEVQE